jgi:hypothetical protein
MLAYVWTTSGRLFNLDMIADGYAHEYTYDLPYRYQQIFRAAEHDAQTQERGPLPPLSRTRYSGERSLAETTAKALPAMHHRSMAAIEEKVAKAVAHYPEAARFASPATKVAIPGTR